MKAAKLGVYAMAAVVMLGSGVGAGDEPDDPALTALLEAHNRERKKAALEPLKLSDKLIQAAEIHARDMAEHHKLDHTGSDGSTMADRVKRAGYVFVRVGENIADGQSTVDEVMKSWMKSPGHRANILGDFTEMGVAHASDDKGVRYWCVDLGTSMPRFKPDDAATSVVKQLNRDREAAGKPLLKADPALGRAATALAAAMAAKDSVKIEVDVSKLLAEEGVKNREVRLQFLSNAPNPEEAARSLLGEDAKQLETFRQIGVGYAVSKSGTPYWCAIFAKPALGTSSGTSRRD